MNLLVWKKSKFKQLFNLNWSTNSSHTQHKKRDYEINKHCNVLFHHWKITIFYVEGLVWNRVNIVCRMSSPLGGPIPEDILSLSGYPWTNYDDPSFGRLRQTLQTPGHALIFFPTGFDPALVIYSICS